MTSTPMWLEALPWKNRPLTWEWRPPSPQAIAKNIFLPIWLSLERSAYRENYALSVAWLNAYEKPRNLVSNAVSYQARVKEHSSVKSSKILAYPQISK